MDLTLTRALIPLTTVLLAITLLGVWLLRPPTPLAARFAFADCRQINLTDPRTGAQIVGAEDLALAQDGDSLIISAHDRRVTDVSGGLYRLSLWSLSARTSATPQRIDPPRATPFRPHGIALSNDGKRLAAITRHGRGADIEIGDLDAEGWSPVDIRSTPDLCRANDLQFTPNGSTVDVTLDRLGCGFSLVDLFPGAATGRVIRLGPNSIEELRRDLVFANGIAGEAVAETRASRISWADGRNLDLPGGPDNISRDPNGRLIVALHPNLFLTFLGLRGVLDATPTRIIAVTPEGKIEPLFDDPAGEVFAGATTAIYDGHRLVAGSAIDSGLLICEAS